MKSFFKNKILIRKVFNSKAFTLVETLVSTFIISMVILGPLTVAMNASNYARQTKDVMIATYLAEESTELLHHLQDSIYLKCVGDTSVNTTCPASTSVNGIYSDPNQLAWVIFKDYIKSGVSCFITDNPNGCAYDFIDMTTNENLAPTKYLPDSTLCNTLYLTTDSIITDRHLYVCSGVHGTGGVPTFFTRKVQVESINTVPSGSDTIYNDDLRVTVTITFRRQNGYTRSIKLVDFFHAHK